MLGDSVKDALARVHVTTELVERLVGGPCGCEERQQKLNALDAWARRVLVGKTADAVAYLWRILS